MLKKLPCVFEEELTSKNSIEAIIEAWKNNEIYEGIIGVTDPDSKLTGILTDGIVRKLSDKSKAQTIANAIERLPIVYSNNSFQRLGINNSIRFGRDCSSNIRKIPVLDEFGVVLGVNDVTTLISEQNTVVGLGYVGVTLIAYMASRGMQVRGVDINKNLISDLSRGDLHVQEQGLQNAISGALENRRLSFSSEMEPSGSYVVAVGTPVTEERLPNYDALLASCSSIAEQMHCGSIVIFRSTVGLGVTRNLLVAELEKKSGLIAGSDFHVAFCPERTAEGVAFKELSELPQLVSGLTDECASRASLFWRKLSPTLVECSSLEVAELAKLSNNTFRDISFAFANELAAVCQSINIDAHEVVEKANKGYTRNRIAYPSVGVGGYCLTKDPYIFANSITSNKKITSLASLGRQKNDNSLNFPLDALKKWLERDQNNVLSSILILGVAFKGNPATSDIRMSPSVEVIKRLKISYPNVKLFYFDFEYNQPSLAAVDLPDVGRVDVEVDNQSIQFDAVFILNNHKKNINFNPGTIRNGGLIFDAYKQVRELINTDLLMYSTIGRMSFV